MRTSIIIVAALVGFVCGWYFSPRKTAPETGDGQASKSVVGASSQERLRSPQGKAAGRPISENLKIAFASGTVSYTEMRALMQALSEMHSGNASEFADFYNEMPFNKAQLGLWQMFFSAWGNIDPDGAIAFIDHKFANPGMRRLFYASVVETWRHDSFAEVFEFSLEKFQSGDESIDSALALEYLRSLAKRDPEQALDLSMKLSDGEFVLDMTARRISELAKVDRNTALEAIEGLTGDTHFHAASQFVIEWANDDPATAAAWLVENYDERYGLHVLGEVAKAFAKSDPVAAMNWIAGLPDEGARPAAFAEAMGAWVEGDPAAASAWLKDQESKPENDAALVAFSHHLSAENPKEVIEEWLPKISDAQQGNVLLAEVSSEWERANPQDYAAWLETTEAIPIEVKQRLLVREAPRDNAAEGSAAQPGESSTGIDQGRDR